METLSLESLKNQDGELFYIKNLKEKFCIIQSVFKMASSVDTGKKEKQLIVLSIPDDAYYRKSLQDIECFIRDMSEKTTGLDDFLVVYSTSLQKRYKNRPTSPLGLNTKRLIVEESLDLWMRDFSPVLPKRQVKFSYKPKYLKSKDAKFVESEFMKVLGKVDVQLNRNDLILDGGNVVDNNSNKVIISERMFLENKGKTPQVLRNELENLFAAKVAFIPDPEDTTGHADGIVAFVEDNVLLIGDYGDHDQYYESVEYAVKSVFPEVETFRLPCGKQDTSSGIKYRILSIKPPGAHSFQALLSRGLMESGGGLI